MIQPLSFTLTPNAIIVGQDSALTLTLTNGSGTLMNLSGGAPVAEVEISPSNPTSFYMDLGTLISPGEFENITVTPPAGWTATFWPDANPVTFGLNPAADVTLAAGGQVQFTLTNILAAESPTSGQLNIDYYNFPGAPDNYFGINVFLQNPPTASPLQLTVVVDGTVYNTPDPDVPISNTMILTITNQQPNPIVSPDTPWESAGPPEFNLTFNFAPYPPGIYALTTVELAKLITVTILNDTNGNWENPTANLQGSQPSWTLTPTAANHGVLGPQSSVQIEISGIQTDFPIVQDPSESLLYVMSALFPGYNDATFPTGFSKEPGPEVLSLYCDPVNLLPGQASVPITLNWRSINVEKAQFAGAGIDNQVFEEAGNTAATLSRGESIVMTATAGESSAKSAQVADPPPPTISASISAAMVTQNALAVAVGTTPYILAPNQKALYAFQSYADNAGTGFAVLSLPDYTVTMLDLASGIPARYGSQNGTMAVTLSPDGSTIYAIVQTQCGLGDLNSPSLLLLSVSVANGSVTLLTDLGQFGGGLSTAHGVIEPCSLAFSPDGSALYVSYCAFAVGLIGDPKPYSIQGSAGLLTLDPTTFNIKSEATFPQNANWAMYPPVIVGADNSGNILAASWNGFGVAAMASGITPVSQFKDIMIGMMITMTSIATTLEGQRIYMMSPYGHTQNASVIALTVTPKTLAITPTQVMELTTQNPGPVAVSMDGSTLYAYVDPGQVRVIDLGTLATFAVQGITAAPTAILPDPLTLGVFHTYVAGTWTVVTVDPWPWTPPTPLPYRPTGFVPSLEGLNSTSNRIAAIANGLGDQETWFVLLGGWAMGLLQSASETA